MNEYDITSIFKDMEDYLLLSMSRNMGRHTNWEKEEGFQWDMWQAKQLESLNDFRKQNSKYVNKQSNFIKLRIDELLKQSNEHGMMQEEIKILNAIKKGYQPKRTPTGVGSSFFKVNDRKLKALIDETNGNINKANMAMLRMTNDEYRKTIFKAQVFANTGTMTTDQAIDLATKDFLAKGINCIEYANGNRVNIASYSEMAIKTANKKSYLQGEGSKRAEWGIRTVLVSRYGACSETCLPWQGKVYVDDVWSGGTAEDSERLGFPLLSVAIAGGLFHPNCKHTLSTYFEGITTIPSKVDVAKTRENSDVIATQRYNERNIRKYKRLENCSLDEQNKAKYGSKVKEWQGKQRELVNAHPEMHRNYGREALRGASQGGGTEKELKNSMKSKIVNENQMLLFDDDTIKSIHSSSQDRNELAKKMLELSGVKAELIIERALEGAHGQCMISVNDDGLAKVHEFILNKNDIRSKFYQEKTVYHEFFHLNIDGMSGMQMKNNEIDWLDIEEVFAETSSHALMKKTYGKQIDLLPSYPEKLAKKLPILKKHPSFKAAETLEDFGDRAIEFRFGLSPQGDWFEFSEFVKKNTIDYDDYFTENYIDDIIQNKSMIINKYAVDYKLEKYIDNMEVDLSESINKVDTRVAKIGMQGYNKLKGNEKIVFNIAVAYLMKIKGVK